MDLRNLLSSSSIKPQQILKVVISLSVVLLVVWLFMISRMQLTDSSESNDPQMIERTDSLRNALSVDPGNKEPRSSKIFMNALTTFFVLIVILIVVYMLTRKWHNQISANDLITLGEHVIGQGAQIKIIELNNEIWIIGITSSHVNLLHRYSKTEWKQPLNKNEKNENNFKNIFKSKL